MIPEDLMRKYKYGYVHSCELLEEPFIKDLLKEIQSLKKQFEKYKKKLMIATKMEINEIDKNTFVGMDYFQHKCINYENQQKEFIKYLEDENKKLDVKANGMGASSERDELITKARTYREILQKYKEIIGAEDDTN